MRRRRRWAGTAAVPDAAIEPGELVQAHRGVGLLQLPAHPELRARAQPGEGEGLEFMRALDEPWIARNQRAALTGSERLRRMEGKESRVPLPAARASDRWHR